MDNYLEIEPLIVARLRAQIPDVPVFSSWGQPMIKEMVDLLPSIKVFLEEDKPEESVAVGRNQKIEQRWLILMVVRDAEEESGLLISRIIRALAGWQPEGGRFFPLRRVQSSFMPDYSPNGIFYFPLTFATHFVFNRNEV